MTRGQLNVFLHLSLLHPALAGEAFSSIPEGLLECSMVVVPCGAIFHDRWRCFQSEET